MASTQQFTLPNERLRLEGINMPEELATVHAGQSVAVEVLPEEPPWTRRIDLGDSPVGVPVLVDDDGTAWNNHWPVRIIFTDPDGREWRLPRHWLSDGVSPVIPASRCEIERPSGWMESRIPPTLWDLGNVNIEDVPAPDGEHRRARIGSERHPERNPEGARAGAVRKDVRDSARLAAD